MSGREDLDRLEAARCSAAVLATVGMVVVEEAPVIGTKSPNPTDAAEVREFLSGSKTSFLLI